MKVLFVMKRQISSQEQDLNICSQDLYQLSASQLELPRELSGIGCIEIMKNIGNPLLDSNRTLCQKNKGSVEVRDQLRWVVGLFTGHCHLKRHLFKQGLTDDPTCERFLEEDESATHILCDWAAKAYLRFRHHGTK
jgi:hypothetical protein